MQANQLYTGEMYAWHSMPRRGRFTHGAQKVRLTYVETRKTRHDANAKTYAHITVVESEKELIVRARELIDFWVDYKREADFFAKEKANRELEIKRKSIRNATVEAMITLKLQEKTDMQVAGNLSYSTYSKTVTLPADELIRWLGVTDEEIEAVVNQTMEDDGNIQEETRGMAGTARN